MEFEFSCKIVKYDPGEGFKNTAVIIFDFEIELNNFKDLVKGLMGSPFTIPIKSIDYIDNNVGKFSDFYNGEIISRASIEFYDLNGIVVSFRSGHIRGWVEDEELKKWEVRSVREFFDGDLLKNVILTNYRFGQIHSSLTETYHISINTSHEERR
ncbi:MULTISPECIES: hypothetical protein [unclassified Paenibacillus]|uniref:hypothetical protein n=1 Tax=unclassified Paenibacillus TaxID=185978 RepID=UPI001AEA70EE|nr:MULTISPECIES: hypothetical protein [unclassified Paenibacillus]MBP1153956.1 hypothetical protein [Paenibacillus sp. PvP091]MBP1170659.1 hypothetical protein [Paenibacillus sp. PvR098]MBP2441687.1 hypothetical protein [Paenibacillus sp. PvP052]